MVIRSWDGTVKPDATANYLTFLTDVMVPEILALPGCLGVEILQRNDREFRFVSRWIDEEAIRKFAGPDPEQAVVPDEARALLAEFDRRARHHHVVLSAPSNPTME